MSKQQRLAVFALVLGILLLASACDVTQDRIDSASADWSRALRVGTSTLNNRPTLTVDDAGRAHMVWVGAHAGGQALRYVRVSPAGKVEIERDLAELAFGYPDTPRLLKASADRLHLAWLTRAAASDRPQGFYHVLIDMDGQVQGSPRCLSDVTGTVAQHGVITPGPAGGACAFWSSELSPEAQLYDVQLDVTGAVKSGPTLRVPGGALPDAQTDAQGLVHLIWQKQFTAQANRTLHYGMYDPQTGGLSTAGAVALVQVGAQNALSGPVLGLTHERMYVLWSLEARGKFAGTAQTFYVSWPCGELPKRIENPAQLWMPTNYHPAYVPISSLGLTEGAFGYSRLAPVGEAFPGFIMQPNVLPGQHEDLLTLMTMNVSTRRESSQPVVLTAFAAGEPQAYQIITRSPGLSTRSVLARDRNGNLYAIWLHQAGAFNFEVYYASTSPGVRETLNAWTLADVYTGSLDYVWSLGVALGFFPLAMVWVFASVIWLGLAYLVYGDVELCDRRGWAILVVAILLHLFSKYFSMPGMFTFVPFIETLPDPVIFVIGRVLTPVLFSGVGLLVMLIYLRRAEYRGAFAAYIAFALVDIVVSLLVYIPTLLGGGY